MTENYLITINRRLLSPLNPIGKRTQGTTVGPDGATRYYTKRPLPKSSRPSAASPKKMKNAQRMK